MQAGNCFDLSIVLASLLTGAGYDAYVVSGYAEKTVTVMDRARSEIFDVSTMVPKAIDTLDPNLESAFQNLGANLASKYKVKPSRQLKSQFILKQEEKARGKKDAEPKQVQENIVIIILSESRIRLKMSVKTNLKDFVSMRGC
jgi:hypothetical protein